MKVNDKKTVNDKKIIKKIKFAFKLFHCYLYNYQKNTIYSMNIYLSGTPVVNFIHVNLYLIRILNLYLT